MSKLSIALIGTLLVTWACGTPPLPVYVDVTPEPVNIHVSRSIQLTATVRNSTNTAVTWSLSGTGCSGAACGTISSTGLYTAPETVPSPPMVTVKATSVADPASSDSASIMIRPALLVTVDPSPALVAIGSTQPFTATVENAVDDDGVTWTLSSSGGSGPEYGTLTATGVYTAPPVVPSDPVITITATSVEDPATSVSTPVTIHATFISVEWTWIAGSDITGQAGVYGTKGLPAPSNVPGARSGSATWSDPGGNLWLFGGVGFDSEGVTSLLDDLWRFDTATLEWTWVSGSDTSYGQYVFYGIKGVPDPLNLPGPRGDAVSWIDSGGNLWLFGGRGHDAEWALGELNDLWKFDPTTLEWTWISGSPFRGQLPVFGTKGISSPSNAPGGRRSAVSWVDPSGNLWLFGGDGFDSGGLVGYINDLWKFDLATQEWTWIAGSDKWPAKGVYGIKGVPSTSNIPGGRESSVASIDPNGKVWLFGGRGFDSGGNGYYRKDLWRFDPITLEWTWIAGPKTGGIDVQLAGVYGVKGMATSANGPGARNMSVLWIDPAGDLWLFGGTGYASVENYGTDLQYGALNDLWKFDAVNSAWAWVSGSDAAKQLGDYGTKGVPAPTNVPGSRDDALAWVDAAGQLWLFGGSRTVSGGYGPTLCNDLWRFEK